jgi:hypothetical protein
LKKTKEVIKDRQSQQDRQYKGQKIEKTKRANQRPLITEGQTTKGKKACRYQKGQSQKDRQHRAKRLKIPKRGNQRSSITEGQTTQGPKV